MRWLLALGLLLLACVEPLSVPGGPATLEEAAAARPEGKRRASVHLVIEATRELEAGRIERARVSAERALRMDGRNAYAFYALAWVGIASRDYAGARRDLEQAEVLLAAEQPPQPRWQGKLLRVRSFLLEREGDPAGAAALRERAMRLDPGGGMPGVPPGHAIDNAR